MFHLVPHTHLDLGWLSTEQELMGSIVKSIIKETLQYLKKNSFAKFSFSDLGFLYMYLKEHPEEKQLVKDLVKSKRLDLINCGFVLADHAATTLDDTLSNLQYGRKFASQFEADCRTQWSIDQFGISAAHNKITRDLGYLNHVINRVPDSTKRLLRQSSDMLFKWVMSSDKKDFMMNLVLADHYETVRPLRVDGGVWSAPNQVAVTDIYARNFDLPRIFRDFMSAID